MINENNDIATRLKTFSVSENFFSFGIESFWETMNLLQNANVILLNFIKLYSLYNMHHKIIFLRKWRC